jgi:hypothetical protein
MKTKRSARISILALGLASATLAATPPRAVAEPLGSDDDAPSDIDLAERYASEAYDAYRVRDYGRAVMLYEKALAAAPSPDIVYNIARVYDVGLLNRRLAITYYERFVADPGAASERLERAAQRLEELRAAENARINIPPPNADAIARDFPLDTHEPTSAPPPIPVRQAPSAADGGLRPLEVGAIALGSAGLVGVGVGIAFGLSARSRSETWQRDCDGNACTTQRGVDAAESAQRRASVATIGFASGGSLIALAGLLWLIDTDDEQSSGASALELLPAADGTSIGGRLSGSF